MKTRSVITILLVAVTLAVYGQDSTRFEYQPYFSAVVVKNIDTSVQWYSALLGLKIAGEINDTQYGNRIIILESPNYIMELLHFKSTLARSDFRKEIQGDFKIGFKVADMDTCIKVLAQLKIDASHLATEATTNKRNLLIQDPDGNWVQFFE